VDNYIVLPLLEPGTYIPKHDPSYIHDSIESALKEAEHDLKAYKKSVAIYKVVYYEYVRDEEKTN